MIRDIAAAQALVEEVLQHPLDDDEAERFRAAVRAANARHLARTASTVELQPETADQPPLIVPGEGRTAADMESCVSIACKALGIVLAVAVVGLVLFAAGVIP